MSEDRLRVFRVEPTEEQREAGQDFFSQNGDCFLAWVNEGDFIEIDLRNRAQKGDEEC